MKNHAHRTLSVVCIIAAFNTYSQENSTKDYCIKSGSTAGAFLSAKAQGQEINYSDLKHNLKYHSDKLSSAVMKAHAEKFSEALYTTIHNQSQAESADLYAKNNQDLIILSVNLAKVCTSFFEKHLADTTDTTHQQKSLDEIQKLSEFAVKNMSTFPACVQYKQMILNNAYSKNPEFVRKRMFEALYEQANQLRCF